MRLLRRRRSLSPSFRSRATDLVGGAAAALVLALALGVPTGAQQSGPGVLPGARAATGLPFTIGPLTVSSSAVTSTVPLQVTSASNSYFTGGGNVGIGTTNPTENTLQLLDSGTFGWSDLSLSRDAANTLAQRKGTNGQAFNLYGTYTNAANYQRLYISAGGGSSAEILQTQGGTGVARFLRIGTTGSSGLIFHTGGADRWVVDANGHFIANADNIYDIGASGATRPRTIYAGTNVVAGASGAFGFSTRGFIEAPADGLVRLSNDAGTGFTRLILGTNDASGISIVKSATEFRFRVGDDTNWAALQAAGATFNGAVDVNSSVKSTSPTSGIGYGAGAGGTVTQLTSKATGVTLNTVTGEITMNGAALAADTAVSFTVTNSAVAAGDMVLIQHVSAGTVGAYVAQAVAAAGSATVTVRNITAGSLSEAIVLKFVVIKAVTS